MKENPAGANDEPRETLGGDLHIYAPDGLLVGEFNGYTVKRATRAALLAAVDGIQFRPRHTCMLDRITGQAIQTQPAT